MSANGYADNGRVTSGCTRRAYWSAGTRICEVADVALRALAGIEVR